MLRTLLLPVILISACSLADSFPAGADAASGTLSVKDAGAIGDGKSDDTAAIRYAISKARSEELTLTFPRGRYRVTEPLEIDAQALEGVVPGAWNADNCPMPALMVEHTRGPALTMKAGSSIHGIAFFYDTGRAAKMPPAILMSGIGLSITNVRIQNPNDGIIADGKSNLGRLNIENVFIVAPRGVGVYVSRTWDIPTLRNIEVWNNDAEMQPGPAFRLAHNDGLRASQLFAFKTNVGFEFTDDETGGFWGILQGCGTDACSIGVRVGGKLGHTIGITGGYFWDHHATLDLLNPAASVRVANAEMKSNGAPAINCQAVNSLLVSNCRFGRAFENKDIVTANLQSGGSVSITGCLFEPMGPCITIGEGIERAIITGNVFRPSPFDRVRDNRGEDSEIVIEANVGMRPITDSDCIE